MSHEGALAKVLRLDGLDVGLMPKVVESRSTFLKAARAEIRLRNPFDRRISRGF